VFRIGAPLGRFAFFSPFDFLLYGDSAQNRGADAFEDGNEPVARLLDDAARMPAKGRIDDILAQRH